MGIKALAATAGNYLGLLDVYAFLKRKHLRSQVVILVYHRVSIREDVWSMQAVSPQSFESQIECLRSDYEILSLDKLVEHLREEKSLPGKAVVITFDDGYKDNYLYAYPILRKYGAPATVFLVTGHIGSGHLFWWDKVRYAIQQTTVESLELDELGRYFLGSRLERSRVGSTIVSKLRNLPEHRKRFFIQKLINASRVKIAGDLGKQLILSWEDVQEMSRNGIDFGAHSVTHAILTSIPLEQAAWEIRQSKEDIERRIGKEVEFFAYPNGDFDDRIVKIIEQSGFVGAAAFGPQTWVTPKTDPYQLNRVVISSENDVAFKADLYGLWEDLQSTLRRR